MAKSAEQLGLLSPSGHGPKTLKCPPGDTPRDPPVPDPDPRSLRKDPEAQRSRCSLEACATDSPPSEPTDRPNRRGRLPTERRASGDAGFSTKGLGYSRARARAERAAVTVLSACKPFRETGLDIERVASIAAGYVPEGGRPPSDSRTILDVMLYAGQELVWRQRYRSPKLGADDAANYFVRVVRDAMFDTRKVPRWYFRSTGIDEDVEDVRIANALAEAEAHDRRPLRKPMTKEERKTLVASGRAALDAMKPPPWVTPKEDGDDDAD